MDRSLGTLTFEKRPADTDSAPSEEAPAEDKEGEDDLGGKVAKPTRYSVPPYHEMYAGLMEQILQGEKTAAIVDDFRYWDSKGRQAGSREDLARGPRRGFCG